MSKHPRDLQPYSLRRTSRRLLAGALGGAALFGAGLLAHQAGAWERMYAALGGHPDAPALPPAEADHAARQAFLAARAARKKDPHAPVPQEPVGHDGYFVPPSDDEIPTGPMGETIRRGRDIFVSTGKYASQYVGNSMSCAQCHLDAGRRENAAPMWAAYVAYPKFREKNNKVNSLEERIAGCFNFSMNAQASPTGKAPPPGDPVYKDLTTYMYWLASGAATGEDMRGAGYLKIKKPAKGYDWQRGAAVYQQNCALCHGADGQGRKDASGALRFPPLWGPESYNWGAGMHSIKTAAGFIKANMPLGKPYSLTDQEAWDVAAFINSHERPKDPRQTGTIDEARAKFHKGDNYYGQRVDGKLLGGGVARTGN
jgi:thiosulfate dehydrogenase